MQLTVEPTTAKEKELIPDRGLFSFCDRNYWWSLDIGQLIKWINGVAWYLDDPNPTWGLAWTIGDADVDLAGSGCSLEDFEGKEFPVTNLYEFLCWASQRLMLLNEKKDESE